MTKTMTLTAAALAVLGTTTIASASSVFFQGSSMRESSDFRGGEFIANLSNGQTYRAFCLEYIETIGLGSNITYSLIRNHHRRFPWWRRLGRQPRPRQFRRGFHLRRLVERLHRQHHFKLSRRPESDLGHRGRNQPR